MTELTALTAEIVCAYVAQNQLNLAELPSFITAVQTALATLDQPEPTPASETAAKPTAAQIRKSITPDAVISFLDGKAYKTLKRHLTTHGLTVESYKAQFGLPADYPMTAPSYSAARTAMALSIGLGQRGRGGIPPMTPAPAPAQIEIAPAAPVDAASKPARRKLHLPFTE